MSRFRLTKDNINDKANEIVSILRFCKVENPCPSKKIMELTGLTQNQLSRTIQFMRRKTEEDFDKYIKYYPISCGKGYYTARADHPEDYLAGYVELHQWCESLKRTIMPMRRMLIDAGINVEEFENSLKDGSPFEEDYNMESKFRAWFLEN